MKIKYGFKSYISDVKKIESVLGPTCNSPPKISDLRAPSSRFIHHSKKFPKYSEFAPKSISGGKKSKRFFVKDFAEEFSLVGEIEYTGEDWPVMLLENCHFKLGCELNIHVKEEITENDEYGVYEERGYNEDIIQLDNKTIMFCNRRIVISIGHWGKKVLSATTIKEGLLEIKSASNWVSTTSLLVKRGKQFSLPEHLDIYTDWLEDLKNVIKAPQKSNMLFLSNFSNYYYPYEKCRVLHLENMFGVFSLTVALELGTFRKYDSDFPCDRDGVSSSTFRRKSHSCYELHFPLISKRYLLEISMVKGLYVGENLTCEADESRILCNYKGFRITREFKDWNEPVKFTKHEYFCDGKSEAKVLAFMKCLNCFFTITTPIATSEVECITLC